MKKGNKIAEFYKSLGRPAGDFCLERRQQDVLFDEKWLRFVKLSGLFRHLPFVEFVFGAGSMALGNVNQNSDFDVIVGVKSGRIWTTRFFCILAFDLIGRRRKKLSHKEEASNKFCFNHFVSLKSYCLRPPYNVYWQELYRNLVPIYGRKEKIQEFFKANGWAGLRHAEAGSGLAKAGEQIYSDDLRHRIYGPSFLGIFMEKILTGRIGDFTEKVLRKIQIQRIEKGLKDGLGFEPRLFFNDDELEFHPDTLRINKLVSDER